MRRSGGVKVERDFGERKERFRDDGDLWRLRGGFVAPVLSTHAFSSTASGLLPNPPS